jgi:uncharacterized protein YkwD
MTGKTLIIFFVIFVSVVGHAQVGLSSDEQKLFNLLNQERKKAAMPPFQWNYHLAESARAHSQLMASHKLLAHQFPGEPALGERLGATGVRFNGAAENVAVGDITADVVPEIHDSLMNSPEHRGNILNSKYNAVGLAIVSRDGAMYVTEDFAHTVTAYSEEQFRDAVIAAFNKARQARGQSIIMVRDDPRIHDLACAEQDKPLIPQSLSNALEVVVFTSSEPENLPSDMQRLVGDPAVHRMSIGTCFHPDKQHGYASFWVVAAFYP